MRRGAYLRRTLLAAGVSLILAAALAGAQQAMPESHPFPAHEHDGGAGDALRSMSFEKLRSNPHLRETALRPSNEADRLQAQEIVLQMRAVLTKYKDYRIAEQEGYRPFFAGSNQTQYYFTNDRLSLIGSLWFRPSKPTSLLYKKTRNGYELLGALYTASQFATEAELNRRVPLSVARWHAHINICLPPSSEYQNADWQQFGLEGSIATEQACAEAGGTFHPQIFGWMLRVYPFEKSPEKIWVD